MRIAFVGPHSEASSGTPRAQRVAAMAAALTRSGADVTVHTISGTRTRHAKSAAGYRLVNMPLVTGAALNDASGLDEDAALAAGLRDFARFLDESWDEEAPDVVHADSWIYGVAAQLAA